ncbi:hypothetical protein BGX38DRAFT_1161612 [Terfezia claveryi]|nr:hypothetical protein BGX38DRAFT_1161612 [Terfezia claveryi]
MATTDPSQSSPSETKFMSAEGVWSGGFANCSKCVQGVLIYQIGQNTWAHEDFRSIPSSQYGFKDAVAKKYMKFQYHLRKAKRVKCSMSLKELQTMPSKTIVKCMPMDILTKFKQRHPITDEDLKDFTCDPSSVYPLILADCKYKKILVFRIRIPTTFLTTLKKTKHLLPTHAEVSGHCGKYKMCNYLLKLMDFESYEWMTTHLWLDKLLVNQVKNLGQKVRAGGTSAMSEVPLHKVVRIWYGLAVNCDQEFAGVPHQNGNNVKHSMNCIIPWVIFFQSRTLTHNVSPLHTSGVRNTLDLYCHQAILDLDKKRRHMEKAQGGKCKSRYT